MITADGSNHVGCRCILAAFAK